VGGEAPSGDSGSPTPSPLHSGTFSLPCHQHQLRSHRRDRLGWEQGRGRVCCAEAPEPCPPPERLPGVIPGQGNRAGLGLHLGLHTCLISAPSPGPWPHCPRENSSALANWKVSQAGQTPRVGSDLTSAPDGPSSTWQLLPNSKKHWTLNEDIMVEHPHAVSAHQDTVSCSPWVEAHLLPYACPLGT